MANEKIDLEGCVIGISRGLASVELKIDTGKDIQTVELPLSDRNILRCDVELIPYQFALIGQSIKFKSSYTESRGRGMTGYTRRETDFEMEILSGPLKGNCYKQSFFA